MSNLKDFFEKLELGYPKSEIVKDLGLIKYLDAYNHFEINISWNNAQELKDLIEEYDKTEYPSITCGIMTYNEERCIKRCLNSVVNEFDEIIVLDSISTDRTVEIIKENFPKVRIYFEPWKNDFSFHRNKIIDLSSSDWIYFIDADNRYDLKNKGKLKKIAKLIDFLKIRCTISPTIWEHDGSMADDTRRMFSLKENILFSGKVHEEPVYIDGSIPRSISVNIDVFHDGYDSKVINKPNKCQRNIRLTEDMIKIEPCNPKWLYFYGRELYQSEKDLQSIKNILNKALDLYNSTNYDRYHEETLSLLCLILFQMKNFKDLNQYVDVLEKISPNCLDVDYYRGVLIFWNTQLKLKKLYDNLWTILNENDKYSYSFIDQSNDHLVNLMTNVSLCLNNVEDTLKAYRKIKSQKVKLEILNRIDNLKCKLTETY